MADSPRHWAQISESGTKLGMWLLLQIYRVFGRWGFRIGLLPVISYYFLTKRQARQASRQYLANLSQTYPELGKLSSFRHFVMFAEILLDKLLVWLGQIRISDIHFISDGYFEQAQAQQRGGIIVVSHLGNTEITNALAHQQTNLKLTLLVYTQHAEKFNSVMKSVNGTTQIELFQVTEMTPAFAMLMAERIEAGEFLVIAGDRTPVTGEQRVSTVNFLGHEADFPQGAFLLANLLKCPVYLLFCLKQKQQYHIHIARFAEQLVANRKQRADMLHDSIQRYADTLAAYARRAPLQWFNFYPFWKDTTLTDKQGQRDEG